MHKIVLVDGNNLLFRSYYATAYSGSILRNSKGFPTNAIYGFVGMINKILQSENPEYIMVAFDIGKNFRKQEFSFYKEGRNATPEELKMQMPIAREILTAMGIKYVELEPYEADDIIGTFAKYTEENPDFASLIVSSDKDLLQLVSSETEIKLLKQSDYIRYNIDSFREAYGIDPLKIIDLKALMGDASDNIPGVKGIGEKTALKLLQTYGSLDSIYENIDSISGKTKEKLLEDKDNAYMSYKIATIYRKVPIDINIEDYKYNGINRIKLKEMLEDLEFHSMLKNLDLKVEKKENNYIKVNSIDEIKINGEVSYYLELDNINYHFANALGMAITDKDNTYFIKKELVNDAYNMLKKYDSYTYDYKKSLVYFKEKVNCIFDLMVASYLTPNPASMDIAQLMNSMGEDVPKYLDFKKNNFEDLENIVTLKSKFIYDNYNKFKDSIYKLEEDNIFNNIEMPLIEVLSEMEINGFKVDSIILDKMKDEINIKLEEIEKEIYELAGEEFNISSPKQLGVVLFEHLEIGKVKSNSRGYKTDHETLEKFIGVPIVDKVLEYRNLSKISSTYLDSLKDYIKDDECIHTIFNQTLTRTGRLSSMEPNLQNIPVREELGRKIRLAFIPKNDLIISADYSQIELRMMAEESGCEELINAFINGEDIHTKVAADIHGIDESEVTKEMRSTAKAVIFGIVYGISSFGLGENLHITNKEASAFINKYYELYPGVKKYMDNIVEFAKERGYVKTRFGRIRDIDEIKDSNFRIRQMGERMALNTPIQGAAADIMKMAMIKVYEELKKRRLKSQMILQIHDEILIDATFDELEEVKSILKESMENVVKFRVPLKVEINTGDNWYKVK